MRTLVLSLALLAVAGCDGNTDDVPGVGASVRVESLDDLADIRDAWERSGPQNYRLKYERSCFCDTAALSGVVTVRDGVVVGDAPQSPQTVESLFNIAADTIGDPDVASVEFRVSSDAPRIPVLLSIDYSAGMADDEFSIRVTGFEAL